MADALRGLAVTTWELTAELPAWVGGTHDTRAEPVLVVAVTFGRGTFHEFSSSHTVWRGRRGGRCRAEADAVGGPDGGGAGAGACAGAEAGEGWWGVAEPLTVAGEPAGLRETI